MRTSWLHRVTVLTVIQLALLTSLRAEGPSEQTPQVTDTESSPPPAEALCCGQNALYMLLKAHGKAVSYDVIVRNAAVRNTGMSLADLHRTSIQLGLRTDVRRCTYEDLVGQCPLPLIALIHPTMNRGRNAGNDIGHYVVVVAADSYGVTALDGTTGLMHVHPRAEFANEWRGYVLVPQGSESSLSLWVVASGISLAAVVVLWRVAIVGVRKDSLQLRA